MQSNNTLATQHNKGLASGGTTFIIFGLSGVPPERKAVSRYQQPYRPTVP